MKFDITMKSPNFINDVLYSLTEAEHSKADIAKAKAMMEQALEYGEYLRVEVDTDEETFTVISPNC